MTNICPFCGAEIKEYKVCPTCHHATGYFTGTEYTCGTIQNDDDKEWFRSIDCLETELARKDEWRRGATKLLNKWLYLEENGLLSCAFSPKALVRETSVFLNILEKKP